MPTAEQLEGIDDLREARERLEQAESALLDALSETGPGADTRREKAERARQKALARIATGRKRALGAGSGFDLLSARHPLLLLPVRLEARFAWSDGAAGWAFESQAGADRVLLVRVYPDDIHDDGHEAELTAAEERVLAVLEKQLIAARDLQHLDDAWADAIRRVGPTRAGWLGELIARGQGPGRRPGRGSRPTVARLLPDRWVAFAELDDGTVLTERSEPVAEPLETGPSPDGMAWMVDFEVALEAGMALVIDGLPAAVAEVRRLVVLGARGTLGPAETAGALEGLLDAQHYTRGLSLMAPGTPTNSLPGARAGFTSRPTPEDVIALERRRFQVVMRPDPLCSFGDDSDGSILAAALGVQTSTFGYVARADATDQQDGRAIRRLLAAATQRRLSALLTGILDPGGLAEAVMFAIDLVSPAGPLPALRVGAQPYGILPVLLRDDQRPPLAGSFAARALPALDALRATLAPAVAGVSWVGAPGANPGETLIRILQRDAVARRIAFRPLLGPQLAAEVANGLGQPGRLESQRQAAAATIAALGVANSLGSPLVQALHLSFAPPLTAPVLEPAEVPASSPQRAQHYLELVAATPPDRLLLHDYGGAERPRSLFFSLARLALLEGADDWARSAHVGAGADPAGWDDESVPGAGRHPLATPLGRLKAQDPLGTPTSVAFHLSEQGRDTAVLAGLRHDLRWLKARPPELIEELVRASLGLFSHRLDPWYTGLAMERLRELRNDPLSATGINVGAFGVVEGLRASPRRAVAGRPGVFTNPFNGGYVHAPSANHGAAAAVLRSVHLAHAGAGHGEAFSVDLSSERVRRGLDLLEGIREGQPLAALLGYRIERELATEGLQRLIAGVRGAAPLVAHRLTPGQEPAESVAATNVVDGLTLLEDAGYDGEQAPTAKALLGRHPALTPVSWPDRRKLDRVLQASADTLDAAADLAVAESVYQAVQGNPIRAGATVDGVSGAPVPPRQDLDVVRTPRTGVAVTHRLIVLLDGKAGTREGWAATPRALAEPRLEAWAQAWLPAPADIALSARFLDDEGTTVAQLDGLTLAELHQEASDRKNDELCLGALDLVLMSAPHETPQRSPLELRLSALIELRRPAAASGAELVLALGRSEDWDEATFGLVEVLEIAHCLRRAIACGRPLAPEDLAGLGATPAATVDPAEGASRAAGTAGAVADAIAALESLTAPTATAPDSQSLRTTLFAADLLGIPGAAPATVVDTAGATYAAARDRARELDGLQHQAAVALAELRRRAATSAALPAGDALGQVAAAFGGPFVALPALGPGRAVTGKDSPFDKGAAPAGATEAAMRVWLARAALVREGAAALDASIGHADAIGAVDAGATMPALHAGQLGGTPGGRWAALPPHPGEAIPGGLVSLVAVTAGADLPTGAIAGLILDEWSEVVPSPEETTSVAFHYDAPTAAAPQAWLLGVPPASSESWSEGDALKLVDEALSLAKLRLVDLDDVQGLGQLLPALVTAENPAGDAVGLDVESLTEEGP